MIPAREREREARASTVKLNYTQSGKYIFVCGFKRRKERARKRVGVFLGYERLFLRREGGLYTSAKFVILIALGIYGDLNWAESAARWDTISELASGINGNFMRDIAPIRLISKRQRAAQARELIYSVWLFFRTS